MSKQGRARRTPDQRIADRKLRQAAGLDAANTSRRLKSNLLRGALAVTPSTITKARIGYEVESLGPDARRSWALTRRGAVRRAQRYGRRG